MSAQKGEMVLLKIGDGAQPDEQFATLGGLRTTRMTVNRQVVVANHAGGGGWREALQQAGSAYVRVQGSGIFTDALAESRLRAQAMQGSAMQYRLHFGNGDQLQGAFVVSNYERSGRLGELESFAVTLESAGDVSYVVPA
jgi:TP901-1 family phage major tail protein